MSGVIVLGGSFDPPHRGHCELVEYAKAHAAEVWVVPCGDRTDKHVLSPALLRLELARVAFPDCTILDIEVQHGPMIPTYFLMKQLEEHDSRVQFLLATDLLPTLKDWEEPERLVSEVNFIVAPRPGATVAPDVLAEFRQRRNFSFIDSQLETTQVSSTWVRNTVRRLGNPEAIRAGLDGLVPAAVAELIISHRLYTED